MIKTLRIAALAALAATAILVVPAVGSAPAASSSTCGSTFQVLHNDHIGTMSLPAGAYTVTVRGGLSCGSASTLLGQFLADYDGNLAYPWTANNAKLSFARAGSSLGFSIKRASFPAPPSTTPTTTSPVACPASFSNLANDAIGSVKYPQGAYKLSLTSTGISCLQASQLFAQFLDSPSGVLPSPWTISAVSGASLTAQLSDVPDGLGFQTAFASSSTGGGGHYPNDGTLCSSSFRVLHDDHIGSLFIPRGSYDLIVLSGAQLTCSTASSTFTRLLNYPSGRLPSPWVLDTATATFVRGAGSMTGFRIKPVSGTI